MFKCYCGNLLQHIIKINEFFRFEVNSNQSKGKSDEHHDFTLLTSSNTTYIGCRHSSFVSHHNYSKHLTNLSNST